VYSLPVLALNTGKIGYQEAGRKSHNPPWKIMQIRIFEAYDVIILKDFPAYHLADLHYKLKLASAVLFNFFSVETAAGRYRYRYI
jgi:hypothetical protein